MVEKSDFEENPKSDLDLDLGFVNTYVVVSFKGLPTKVCLVVPIYLQSTMEVY